MIEKIKDTIAAIIVTAVVGLIPTLTVIVVLGVFVYIVGWIATTIMIISTILIAWALNRIENIH